MRQCSLAGSGTDWADLKAGRRWGREGKGKKKSVRKVIFVVAKSV